MMDYNEDIAKATAQKKQNKRTIQRLKKLPEKKVDDFFHSLHDVVFQEIDCLNCANCCKTTSPIFRDIDIDRLAKHLKISSAQLIEKHLHIDQEGDYVLNSSPCVFLQEDNKCSVYEYRPLACREYPHTNRKKMHQILNLSLKNTTVCPAVSRIFEAIRIKL